MKNSKSIQHIFSEWNMAIRSGDWHRAETFLAADVIVNHSSMARHAYVQKLQHDKFQTARLDMCIFDDNSADIAARYTFPSSSESLNQGEEWTEQTLFTIISDKISVIETLAGANSCTNVVSDEKAQVNLQTRKAQSSDLRKFYNEYIGSINALTMREHFHDFCQDVVTHNFVKYGRDDYREMIESSFKEISGLRFTIERLIVNAEDQRVAARLGFTGVPTKEFRGIAPTGNSVVFSEHAFYQLEQGRIKQVWSLLDLASYRASLAS
ncbi:hypothetical protein LLEC1_01796 [Akanthomyces lecanii]|uniref:SnoaL-like domain-containing protein n=1 Tax=Cordyceps confragosa TaxID=2714763 RepID=A0A179IJF6_CORDF|nr:hypothetical protein LLEC1_01796 [Akanthomyces lecanii]